MKKYTLLFVLLLLVSVLTACSSSSSANSDSEMIPIYSPPTSGAHYILSAGMSQIFKENEVMPGVSFSVQATSDEATKFQKVLDGYEMDSNVIGVTAANVINDAYNNGEFENVNGDTTKLRAIAYTDGAPIHIVVPANSDIKTWKDLKGKEIGVFPGSAPELLFKDILEHGYGYVEEEDYTILPFDYTEVQQGIQDKSIQAGMLMGSIPSALVLELQSNTDVRVISLDQQAVDKYLAYKPETMISTINVDTYENNEELLIPFVPGYIFTHEATDDEVVYNILKTLLEYPEQIGALHATSKNITAETIKNGISIPFHSGAEKYFEENGIN